MLLLPLVDSDSSYKASIAVLISFKVNFIVISIDIVISIINK